ncbi:MAG TPA: acetamidase, partial [Lacunisphaera sp.]
MHSQLPSSRIFASVAAALAFAASLAALEVPYDYHVKMTPETTIFGCFSATKKPVLTIKSGATVKIDGGGAAEWGREGGEAEANAWLKANKIDATTETCPAIK